MSSDAGARPGALPAAYHPAMALLPRLRHGAWRAGAKVAPEFVRDGVNRLRALRDAQVNVAHGRRFGSGVVATVPRGPAPTGPLERYFDQHTKGSGVWKWRHYFPIYERHLAKFVGGEVHVVEIGVFSGGSLEMWHHYFGGGATVYGIDLEPACRAYEGPRTRIFIGDQADPQFWASFTANVPAVDVVIDDGGHKTHQQIATLEALLPRLRPGGVYICEDIQGERNPFLGYAHGLSQNLHAVGVDAPGGGHVTSPFQADIDSIHLYPFVMVIEKRDARVEKLIAPKQGTVWEPFFTDNVFPGMT